MAVYERDRTRTDRLQGYRIHIDPHGSRASTSVCRLICSRLLTPQAACRRGRSTSSATGWMNCYESILRSSPLLTRSLAIAR